MRRRRKTLTACLDHSGGAITAFGCAPGQARLVLVLLVLLLAHNKYEYYVFLVLRRRRLRATAEGREGKGKTDRPLRSEKKLAFCFPLLLPLSLRPSLSSFSSFSLSLCIAVHGRSLRWTPWSQISSLAFATPYLTLPCTYPPSASLVLALAL